MKCRFKVETEQYSKDYIIDIDEILELELSKKQLIEVGILEEYQEPTWTDKDMIEFRHFSGGGEVNTALVLEKFREFRGIK